MARLTKAKRRSEIRMYSIDSKIISAQLQDIEFYDKFSEETFAFTAILVLVCKDMNFSFRCRNNGQGESTNIYPLCSKESIKDSWLLLKEWDSYLKTLRNDSFYSIAEQMGVDVSYLKNEVTKSAESEIDNLLYEWINKYNL